jgi:hypothetical protein
MNLLGMKRKLLPYGMALGGAGGSGSALGAMSAASPSSGGGKSAPVGQNTYGSSFGGQNVAPTSAAPSGGKSSGLGQGGYGSAPAFQQPIRQDMSTFDPNFNRPNVDAIRNSSDSTNTTTQQDMMGGNRGSSGQDFGQVMQGLRGGKSSGLGQGGYGGAPGFGGGMNQMGGFSDRPLVQPGRFEQELNPYQPGGLPPTPPQQGMGAAASQRQMQGGFGPQRPDTSQEGYNQMMALTSYRPGTAPNYEQWKQQTENSFSRDQSNFASMGGMGGIHSGMNLEQQRAAMGGMGGMRGMGSQRINADFIPGESGQFKQPSQQFNPYQQQFGGFQQQPQFNPFQQQFNPYQQQPQFNPFQQQQQFQQPQNISGLQGLFNQMMGQQQMQQRPMQQMPRFQSQALQYRPNMQNAQAALSRVKPSVQGQQQDAQAARIAELEAQIAAFQPQTPTDYGNSGG